MDRNWWEEEPQPTPAPRPKPPTPTPPPAPAEAKWWAAAEQPAPPGPPVARPRPPQEPAPPTRASEEPPPRFFERLRTLPKPLLFGLFGAVGGLLGALLLAEIFWGLLSPSVLRDRGPEVQLAVPEAMRLYAGGKNRLVVKIGRDSHQGAVVLEAQALPPGVTCPPVIIPAGATEATVEVEAGPAAPAGRYRLPLRARAAAGDHIRADTAGVTLTVEQPPPGLRLAVPPAVALYQGGKNTMLVRIGRSSFAGSVTIEPTQPLPGLTVSPVVVPADNDQATIEIEAAAGAVLGEYRLPLRARGADDRLVPPQALQVIVKVEPIPVLLRLAAPPKVSLYQGGKGRFTIRVGRTNFSDSVVLDFANVPAGLSLPRVTVPPGSTEAQVEIQAPSEQPTGSRTVRVQGRSLARSQPVQGDAEFQLDVLQLPKTPLVDVVFVLDLTGSMSFAINGIKDGIEKFVGELEGKNIDARIGLIGFRDIDADLEEPFVMKVGGASLTNDYRAFRDQVKTLQARGGGDGPESSYQGLALAAKQPFRPLAGRVLVLITDAPPKIHAGVTPSTLEETVAELEKLQVNQLHVMSRQTDYNTHYRRFNERFKGSHFDISGAGTSDSFVGLLPKLSDAISRNTTASTAALPDVGTPALPPAGATTPPPVSAPPPLPSAGGAELPLPAPAPAVRAVRSTERYAAGDRYWLILASAAWAMLVAAVIAWLLLVGQRFYLRQGWGTVTAAWRVAAGGLIAGLAGGAFGEVFFQATAGGLAWEVVSRILGWSIFGGLIGYAMSYFVPNLLWSRGLLGGILGGIFGGLAFQLVSLFVGAMVGRLLGAILVGFWIGVMIALAELAFRRRWLEVAFSPREVRAVTLGTTPIVFGSDERQASVVVPGSPALALRYRLDGERVLCDDTTAQQTLELRPGETRTLGRVTITLRSAEQAKQLGYVLQLGNGRALQLTEGLPLTAEELPGLQAQGADGVVALVASRPSDGKALLRNRSRQTWSVRGADGSEEKLAPGRSLELREKVEIAFGELRGRLEKSGRP